MNNFSVSEIPDHAVPVRSLIWRTPQYMDDTHIYQLTLHTADGQCIDVELVRQNSDASDASSTGLDSLTTLLNAGKADFSEVITISVRDCTEAFMWVTGFIDHYLLEAGGVCCGELVFCRPDDMIAAITALQSSNQWLMCGNMPILFQAELFSPHIHSHELTQMVLRMLDRDRQWRESVAESVASGHADEEEQHYLQQQAAGIRLWKAARLSDRVCTHYLRWMRDDTSLIHADGQCRSLADMMLALRDIEPDAFFPCEDNVSKDPERFA